MLLWRCCLLLGLYGGFNEGSARVLSVFCDPMMVLQWFYGFNKGSIRALWKLWGSMMIIRSFGGSMMVLWGFYGFFSVYECYMKILLGFGIL